MKKYIPNILTSFRIFLSILLLIFFNEINYLFLMIFTIGAFTDLIDGILARKYHACSITGSVLDTIGDILLYSNIIKIILMYRLLSLSMFNLIILIFIISLLSPLISFIKFKKIYFIHSISSKIVGFLIFLIPYTIIFNISNYYLYFVILLFSFSIIENVIMQLLLNKPNSDAKTIFHIIKKKESKS